MRLWSADGPVGWSAFGSAEWLRVGLGSDCVDIARLARWPPSRVRRGQGAAFTSRAGEPAWQAALDAMAQALDGYSIRGETLSLRLSNRWTRYAVLPWTAELAAPSELEQLARLRFEQRAGAAVAGWTVRVSDGGWGRSLLACAIDTALLDGLRSMLRARGLKLGSVQPLLMAVYNDWRTRLQANAALAVIEADRVCVGLFDRSGWREISSRRFGGDPAAVVAQELATLADDDAPTRVDVLLVGDVPDWPSDATSPAHLLGRRALSLCGAA